ncbi:hypothetical protein G6F64_014437 [Rhizopus arrhizus]|uniref:Uncharacterized protein n=1 Tax=Rhizopus oryzae TaxID=64495 RepID=A0A9P6WTE3_RHIOR|nr:hypothetical protein G6F64_014437 [Rhizopus arrhizus]
MMFAVIRRVGLLRGRPRVGQFHHAELGFDRLQRTRADDGRALAADLQAFQHGFFIAQLAAGEQHEVDAAGGLFLALGGQALGGLVPAVAGGQHVAQLDVQRMGGQRRQARHGKQGAAEQGVEFLSGGYHGLAPYEKGRDR